MSGDFRPALELLVQYARRHRDHRNIVTHLVGVPLIVFGVAVLLARPVVEVAGFPLTPAWLLWVLTSLWYLSRGELLLGLTVSAAHAAIVALGQPIAALGTTAWLASALSSFVFGCFAQAVGHYYEGHGSAETAERPFLLVGPLFVAAEGLFALGLRRDLMNAIERRAGPVVLHDLAARA